ncbi:MAG: porin family protein [Devosiaceae bacterium]|nr:porin family protein [Devosiaceae bacterium MH13]
MVSRLSLALLLSAAALALKPAAALSADAEFEDFPDVPDIVRFDETFRDAGFYAGARGGVSWAQSTSFTLAGPQLVSTDYDAAGLTGSAFLGFEIPDLYWGLGARAEFELGALSFDVDTHTIAGTVTPAADSFGDTTAFTLMANLYADYSFGSFQTFVGAGLGTARFRLDGHGVTGALNVMSDAETAFAWQAMAGLAYHVTPSVTVEAMARYQAISDVTLTSSTGPSSDVGLESVGVLAGIRLGF